MTHRSTFVVALALLSACVMDHEPEPAGGGGGGASEPADRPGECLSVWPGDDVTYPTGGSVNPVVYDLGEVPVGEPVDITVGYYHECADPYPEVLESGWRDGAATDPSFEILEAPDAIDHESSQSYVRLRLTPAAPGSYEATFRMQLDEGWYDITMRATAVAP